MNTILITGGAGYIGIHTSLILLEKGFNLVLVDSFSNSSKKSIERLAKITKSNNKFNNYNFEFFEGDVRDINFLRNVFEKSKLSGNLISTVIHFAGLKSVAESISNPNLYWDVNVYGTVQLLKIMNEYECKNLVFSSSATVYSPQEKSPLYEDFATKPIDPYGKTKLTVENILKNYSDVQQDNLNIVSLRYFNPIGAHPSGEIGEYTFKVPNNLFPYICDVAISKRDVLNIFGNDWPTEDGTCVRDFIHIMDLAEGHLDAIAYLCSNESCYESINLGSGKGYSVFQIISEFELSTGCQIPFSIQSRRDGDLGICYADISKAKILLGWHPKRSLKEICLDGWNWQRKNPSGYT